ncbi:TetR/AcrR family transcriptional regulator [Pelagibius litoralis]|uniref:TetR/AcrR family transcriptional regulator n=1 Tax=Pelagibius litoralis TaxID=374515 RepID=A0A967EVB7_9PROT|nr:TetR/AcrR family transcriptional regulator [Pelagibius litoralis]NIA68267.1 TetR/AcrR family transcriptional regulator [Pelagibius litoralis]
MLRARTPAAKDERRQALLKAALDEFFDRGFTAARMDDIARRAGLSKGALYLYFDSKDALFIALIETVAAPNVEKVEHLAAAAPSATAALHALTGFMPHLIRETPLPRVVKVLLADAGAFPDVVRRYRSQVIDRVLAAIAAVLERGKRSGELAVDDPKLTARLVVAPVLLSAIWSVVFEIDPEARVDLDALFALHKKMLLHALAANPDAAK